MSRRQLARDAWANIRFRLQGSQRRRHRRAAPAHPRRARRAARGRPAAARPRRARRHPAAALPRDARARRTPTRTPGGPRTSSPPRRRSWPRCWRTCWCSTAGSACAPRCATASTPAGPPARSPTARARPRRSASWPAREGIDLSESYAYSDSESDLPMLRAVGHPVAVNPDSALEKVARAEGWRIMRFDRLAADAEDRRRHARGRAGGRRRRLRGRAAAPRARAAPPLAPVGRTYTEPHGCPRATHHGCRALVSRALRAHARARRAVHHAVRRGGRAALHRGRPAGSRADRLPGRVPVHARRLPVDVSRPAVDDAPVRRVRHGRGDQRALPLPARPRPDRPVDRVRHAVADGPRLRPSALARARSAARAWRSTRSTTWRRCSAGSTWARCPRR